ncbi:WYL domain-containing protein [Patescibacteria group bacterium]|nr:WYL domain-containing protein [Patescibacteria group bacterium]
MKQLAFLDVETTGLDPDFGDRVCEIGIVVCNGSGFDVVEEFGRLVNPERHVSPVAHAINNIDENELKKAPMFADLIYDVERLLKDKIVVCHNAPFDLNFITKEFSLAGKTAPVTKFIDTLQLARRYFNFPSNSLQNIAKTQNIEVKVKHRALSDADTTRKVLKSLMAELSKNNARGIMNFVNNHLYDNLYADKDKKILAALPCILEEVIRNGKKIYAKYLSSAGKCSERIIEPRELVYQCNSMYLVGFCHLKKEDRTFRLDRFLRVEIIT